MKLLFRYLVRNNAFILLPTLGVGIGLYLLTDLFERLDNFVEAGVPVSMVLLYFAVKTPLVISQILPVIFLLSTVIQLCLMARSRELMALQAGGISLGVVARSMLLCGIFWGAVQLTFSEYLGVAGERESARIWQEEVRKRNLAATVLHNQWFADGQWIVSLATLSPDNSGTGFTGYRLLAPHAPITGSRLTGCISKIWCRLHPIRQKRGAGRSGRRWWTPRPRTPNARKMNLSFP